MALVHQSLYRAESQRSVDAQSFLDTLIDELAGNYAGGAPAEITTDIAKRQIPADVAVPLSLIVNELVTNALKYAFPAGTPGTIGISCQATDENVFVLTVADDGVGLPPDFDLNRSESLGMRLVQGLTEQLSGSVEFSPAEPGAASPGTRCTVQFPLD
jgi:two-component sensor histidine kinase